MSARVICAVLAAVGVGSCAGRMTPALEVGQRQLYAHNWQGAIDGLEAAIKASRVTEAPDQEMSRAHFMLSQAWMGLGRPAQALKAHDQGVLMARLVDDADTARRAAILDALRASTAGPATCALRINYDQSFDTLYVLESLKLVLDDQPSFAWQMSEKRAWLLLPARVLDANLAAGEHYVTFEAVFISPAWPQYRFKIRRQDVVACTKGQWHDGTWTTIHKAGAAIEDLDVNVKVQAHPIPPPVPRAGDASAPSEQPPP